MLSCRRYQLRGEPAPQECSCIKLPEQQWLELFRLRYPEQPHPDIFGDIPFPKIPSLDNGNCVTTTTQPVAPEEDYDDWFKSFTHHNDYTAEGVLDPKPSGTEAIEANTSMFDGPHRNGPAANFWQGQEVQDPQQNTWQQHPAIYQGIMQTLQQRHAGVVTAERMSRPPTERIEELRSSLVLVLNALARSGSDEYADLNRLIRPKILFYDQQDGVAANQIQGSSTDRWNVPDITYSHRVPAPEGGTGQLNSIF